MLRLFVGNFDFELALAAPRRVPPEVVRRASAELAAAWVAVADDGDFVWTPEPIDEAFFDELAAHGLPHVRPVRRERDVPRGTQLVPWGWTAAVRRWAARHARSCDAPLHEAVREANSRRLSFQLEAEWGVGLDGAGLLTHTDELAAALHRLPAAADRWVLKAEFGMSGRERLPGAGREITNEIAAWLRKRLADGCVVLEPWVERLEEIGVQFEIPRRGEPQLVGLTPLLTDATGVYRGSRFHADAALQQTWSEAITTCRRAADRLHALGYFGPAGFDAVRYRDFDGTVRLRPLQDINARWTMGRLALGFRRLLTPGEVGTWLHVNWPGTSAEDNQCWLDRARTRLSAAASLIPTSPLHVGGRPTRHGTLLLVADTHERLLAAEELLGHSL